ncbi:uncharacterized protein Z519_00551 [Cladophialophora bantiana CBS 173.52]|uniref:Prenylated Rab acceptor 1 n=1 Tax=Cladophialophora bantiana (strain ATCC 10958 / CBS 173.52 / CDC B-1940 / NIH 8579) TaxID=1442370 RepID=A0A0D2HZK0_CLAB1|nr:uncharacterized protein Z519_00551 [Cladophialophora bantiana CBS 173.52]KIW98888.1 hypothetical protein Z519_00551 [Cladophialophora bantiana CBS 173.52]
MPPGGRPPRGRPGRNNDRLWELQQQRSWDYDVRVEELDTDDDNSPPGVELDQGYGQSRFRSDELHFTGIDLGGGVIRRRRSGDSFDNNLTPSDDEDDYDAYSGLIRRPDMQMAYREKEDMLVQRALERIARARALGKPNVKLSRAEIDALKRLELERSQTPPQSPAAASQVAPRSKKEAPVVKRKPVEVRKASGRSNGKSSGGSPTKGKAADGRNRGRSSASNTPARENADISVAAYELPPPDLDYDRRLPYPQGYYVAGPRQAEPLRQGSRTNSNQSLRQQQMQPMLSYQHHYQHPYYSHRYSSNPDPLYSNRPSSNSSRSSRPDPSEPDWEPRARSTSSLVNVPLDQLPYQTSIGRAPRFDPSDPRFASPQRRVVSGPPGISQNQAGQYRRLQDELFLSDERPEVYNYLAPSDTENQIDDDDEGSDYVPEGEVVDVRERPRGEYAIQTRSAAAGTSSQRARSNGKTMAGKSKKGR